MPRVTITDDDIARLYTAGVPMTQIRANNTRIHKVVAERNLPPRTLRDDGYAKQPGTAPPGEWEDQLRETAKQKLPPSVPRYHGESKLRARLNQRRRREASGLLNLA